jgi:hypothetical protein
MAFYRNAVPEPEKRTELATKRTAYIVKDWDAIGLSLILADLLMQSRLRA